MKDEESTGGPYIPANETVAETSVRAVALGIVLAIIMAAANTYLGLYAGMTVSASIPAAVVSMALLRGIFRRGTILENNIAQTIASTGESLAAGAIFTIPALVLVGVWQEFEFWPTTFIVMLGGMLGIVFMVPLRRALIVERQDLVYPEGVACSEVLIVGQEGGAGVRSIALGLLIGAVFKFLVTGLALIKGAVEGAVAAGRSVFYFGSDMSVMLVGVGYIVNLQIASQVFLGGAIAWIIAMPILGGYGGAEAVPPVDAAWELWSSELRYLGVGAMLIGGLHSIWHVRRGILSGVMSLRAVPQTVEGKPILERTERDLPLTALLTVFLLSVFGTFALYEFLIGSLGISFVATVVMIAAAFLFAAVATYIAGLVGSSNSPVSGMTICALLMAAGILLALGVRGDSAILATLGVAGVVCCTACTAGDVSQDLKTGLLVGATPARQQWTEMIGVVVPAFFFAPIMTILHEQYVIGEGLLAPQAALFASLAEGFFGDGTLPWNMIFTGVGIGAMIIAADTLMVRFKGPFRLYIMPVAVGMYLPLSLAVPILLGGLIRYGVTRGARGKMDAGRDQGVLFGSGLVAGEALMGIGLAVILSLFTFPNLAEQWGLPGGVQNVISLASFAAVAVVFIMIARSSRNENG